jgi:hypothetical protein
VLRYQVTSASLLCLLGLTSVGCSTDNRVKASMSDIAREQEESSLGVVSEAVTATNLWTDNFTTFSATRNSPVGSGKNWYIQQHTNFNGEQQIYEDYLYNNADTTTNAVGVVCSGTGANTDTSCAADSWVFKIDSDPLASDGKALVMRTFKKGSSYYGPRLNSKRLREYQPTTTTGIKVEARIRFPTSTIGNGVWPAFWMLGSAINEDPLIRDYDNVSWPCDGAAEFDIMETASLWGSSYNQSSVHYGFATCQPQVKRGSLAANKTYANYDSGTYHVYAMEWEPSAVRFLHTPPGGTEAQYGPTLDTAGLSMDDKMFILLNMAAGGGLGGTVTDTLNGGTSGFPLDATKEQGGGKLMYVDWVKVGQFSLTSSYTARNISNPLYAADGGGVDTYSGVQFEDSTVGGCNTTAGRNMGFIDPNDAASWYVNVPAAGDYKLESCSAVNSGGGSVQYDVSVDSTKLATVTMPNTAGWQTWQSTYSTPFTMSAGNHWLNLKFLNSSQNLRYVRLTAVGGANCTDGVKNQNETFADCGGVCGSCCSNGKQDQDETGTDCGGSTCGVCAAPGARLEVETNTTRNATNCVANTAGLCNESADGGTTVGYFSGGDWLRWAAVDFTGMSKLTIRLASGAAGTLDIRAGADASCNGGTLIKSLAVASTGGWANWSDSVVYLSTTVTGTQSLCLKGAGAVVDFVNLNHVTLGTNDNSTGGGAQTGTNLLVNGTFTTADAVGGWAGYYYTAGGSISMDATTTATADGSGSMKVNHFGGGVEWYTQIFETRVVAAGTRTLSIKGKVASGSKAVRVFCEEDGDANGNGTSYQDFGSAACTLGTGWTTCNATCTIPAGVSIKYGMKGGTDAAAFWMDDATLN